MSRTPVPDDQPWRRIARGVLPPAATVLLSVAILAGAVWVRKQENTARLESSSAASLGGTGSVGTQSVGTGSGGLPDKGQSLTQPHVTTGNTTHATSTHGNPSNTGSNKVSTSKPSGSKTGQPAGKSGNAPAPTGVSDVGFAPVTGGSVTSMSRAERPSESEVSSVVREFGTNPDTTWQQRSISGPNGVTVTLPAAASPSSDVVLPLRQGVLWAQIPQTQISPTGTLGPSATATSLWYTPFPSAGTQVITQHAQLLGTIPATVTELDSSLTGPSASSGPFTLATPPITWYGPTTGTLGAGSGNQTANNTTGSGGTTNSSMGTGSTGSSSGSASGSSSTSSSSSTSGNASGTTRTAAAASSAEAYLYLNGLYQTTQGAILALQATSSSATDATATWLYDWREATGQLTPIAALPNGNGTFSWFAPGTNLLYFGIRSVIPPLRIRFSGHQFVYDTATLTLTPIRLGTWASSAYTSGDKLIFDVRNSTSWESFTPAGQP